MLVGVIYAQEQNTDKKSIEDMLYVSDFVQTITTGTTTSSISTYSDFFSTVSSSVSGLSTTYNLWRATYKGNIISAYDFFKTAGYEEAANREYAFYQQQLDDIIQTKSYYKNKAKTSWAWWGGFTGASALTTVIGLITWGSTGWYTSSSSWDGYESNSYESKYRDTSTSFNGFITFLVGISALSLGLAYIYDPLDYQDKAENYSPTILYTTHAKDFAQKVADEYNNQ